MVPGGQSEPLFLSSLEILSYYKDIMAAFPDSSSPLESDNTRHFFSTITDNLENQEMKAVLQQKIAQLVSSAAWLTDCSEEFTEEWMVLPVWAGFAD